MSKIITDTQRLMIRTPIESDGESLLEIWTDPEVMRYMGGPRDPTKFMRSFEEALRDLEPFDLWPVIEKQTETIIGHCGFLEKTVNDQQEVEVIYLIAAKSWGKGYATEASVALCKYAKEKLGIKRLIALIDRDNTPSERVAVKIGMTFEKETIRPSGKTMKVYATIL